PAAAAPAAAANDLADGESREVKGSGSRAYVIKNTAGVYSCTCPAWMHQGFAIERRSCKHLKALRGEEAERLRVGGPAAAAGSTTTTTTTATASRGEGVAPALLLAHAWESDVDLTGWWMSEKLDGVRAYWDGTKLISRLGNTFWAPEWFLDALPKDMPLDGELFGGRKKFQRTVSIVRRQDRSDAWREISYLIFDAPSQPGAFEDRLAAIETLLATRAVAHLRAHPHEVCRGLDHVREELARVEGLGGEGLMMRRPGSRYESGRSSSLLKVKTFHDTEAVVVAHLPGAGRHKGRLGALECDLPDGTRFSVGTGFSDAERESPPPVGAVITFRYQELTTDGVPRFPSYIGVRDDVAWPPANDAPRARAPAASARVAVAVPAPVSARAAVASPSTTRDARIFTRDGATWQITLTGSSHSIRRLRGEAIETVSVAFTGAAAAWRDAERQIAAQLAEGWTEIPDDGEPR
ncbi:MAG TPA: DNA ligase, partial [Labilithrix sp.]|nr:DNA ligase [Labilithrix sp.]